MKKPTRQKLDRRGFLKSSGAGLVGLSLLSDPHSPAYAEPVPYRSLQRRIFPLNHGWLYSDKVAANSTRPEFDDRQFERVTIPHTNQMLPWHGFDDKEFQFVSLYRRHFKLPGELRGSACLLTSAA